MQQLSERFNIPVGSLYVWKS